MSENIQMELFPTPCPECTSVMQLIYRPDEIFYKCPECGYTKRTEEKPEEPDCTNRCSVCSKPKKDGITFYKSDYDDIVCESCLWQYISDNYDAEELADALDYSVLDE